MDNQKQRADPLSRYREDRLTLWGEGILAAIALALLLGAMGQTA